MLQQNIRRNRERTQIAIALKENKIYYVPHLNREDLDLNNLLE